MARKLKNSYWRQVWRQFKRNPMAMLGLSVVASLIMVALCAPLLANDAPLLMRFQGQWYAPMIQDVPGIPEGMRYREVPYAQLDHNLYMVMAPIPYSPTESNLERILEAPSADHWLGTDDQGRDVLARLIHGTRIAMSIGFVAMGLAACLGIIFGALAGYYGGWVDICLSRAIEVMYCFPTFFLILAVLAFLEPSIYNIMIVIGATGWPGIARLIRGEFFKVRNLDYVSAMTVLGGSDVRIMLRHILPNAIAPVLVSVSFGIASAILAESGLSFLGFGVPPYEPSWGDVLARSREFLDIAWWLTISPGVAIFITVTAYNLVGEGLRDAIDPRMRDV